MSYVNRLKDLVNLVIELMRTKEQADFSDKDIPLNNGYQIVSFFTAEGELNFTAINIETNEIEILTLDEINDRVLLEIADAL